MNFSMGNSGRQGFYDEEEGNHLHQYPCSNSPSSPPPNYEKHQHNYEKHQHQQHHHRGWLDSCGGEGGGGPPSSQLEVPQVMDERGGGSEQQQVPPPVVEVEREHMFDKVVTPSDVGKLNRLVIPKQHAERYFPLDSSTNEKGLLLNFEDRHGKPWRFRYSYWNSSQSYVMTKGWSRFVKEKKLDAGDIVSFQRGVGDLGKDRLFIDWRRRPDHAHAHAPPHHHPQLFPRHHHLNNFSFQRLSSNSSSNNFIHHHPNPMVPWNPIFLQSQRGGVGEGYGYGLGHQSNSYYGGTAPAAPNYNTSPASTPPCPGSVIYLRSVSAPQQQQLGMQFQIQQQRGILSSGSGIDQVVQPPVVFESVPVVHGQAAAAKRLRLFGVNMDFPSQELPFPSTNDHYTTTSSSSSSTIPYIQLMPNYNIPTPSDKPKPSMSLDLDI